MRGAFIEYGMARKIVVQSESFAYKGNTKSCTCGHIVNITLYHIEAETKWPPFSRRHFQMEFC